MNIRRSAAALGGLLVLVAPLRAAGSSFTDLGFLPGFAGLNSPTAMTDDGRAVVGLCIDAPSGHVAPYIWRRDSGISSLSDFIPGPIDDVTISGGGDAIFVVDGLVASRWTQAGGLTDLFNAPAGSYSIRFSGSSSDGRTVAGLFFGVGPQGEPDHINSFVWREGLGLTTIDDGFIASGISPDGRHLVGARYVDPPGSGLSNPIRRSVDGVETILEPESPFAAAVAASNDGSIVIGSSHSVGFRWSANTSTPIGQLPLQNDATSPLDLSYDGSVVVGYAEAAPQGAFIWDMTNGIRSLHELLLDDGVDVSSVTLGAARFVSADGRTIVGTAPDGIGGATAWIATLIPEPHAVHLAVGCALVLAASSRRVGHVRR
jgi:uncharacterized membrane protein